MLQFDFCFCSYWCCVVCDVGFVFVVFVGVDVVMFDCCVVWCVVGGGGLVWYVDVYDFWCGCGGFDYVVGVGGVVCYGRVIGVGVGVYCGDCLCGLFVVVLGFWF